jgi:tetratricopeptide (TPR) repeat protein
LRTIDDHAGGQRLLTVVAHQQRLLVQLALQHGEGSAAAVDLLHLLAQYSQFAGWLALDLDQHARAQRSFLIGLRLAQFVGDDDLVAVIISCLALQGLNRAALSDAVHLARWASALPCASDTAAIVWMRRGRASAALGEVREADRSFERATTLLAEAETEPRRPWSYWLTDDIMAAEQGRCFVDLGRSRPAQIVLARTVHRNGDAGRDRVLYGAALAQAHLAAGELDQACDELHRTTALLATTSSHRCRSLLQGIVDDLGSCRLPARHQDLVATAAHTLTGTVEGTA